MEEQIKKAKMHLKMGELSDFEFTDKMKRKVLSEIHSQKKLKYRKIREGFFPVCLTILFATLFFLGMYIYVLSDHSFDQNAGKTINKENHPTTNVGKKTSTTNTEKSLPDFKLLFAQFHYKETEIMKDVDQQADFKFKSFNTKNEFYKQFANYTSKEVIEKLYSTRLDERKDGLYLVPMDSSFHFDKELPTTTEKITDTEYHLIQKSRTDLYGKTTLTATFKKIKQNWIITNIDLQH